MASVKVEMTFEDLQALLKERDELKARIAELEREPLKFSLPALSRRVLDKVTSLTPGQRDVLIKAIHEG